MKSTRLSSRLITLLGATILFSMVFCFDSFTSDAAAIETVNPETTFVRLYLARGSGGKLVLTTLKPSSTPLDEEIVSNSKTWDSGPILTGDILGGTYYFYIRSASTGETLLRGTIRVNGALMGTFDFTAKGPLLVGDSGNVLGIDPDLTGPSSVSLEIERITGPTASIQLNGVSYIDLPNNRPPNIHGKTYMGFLDTDGTGIKTHLPKTRRGAILPVYLVLGTSNVAISGSWVVPYADDGVGLRTYAVVNGSGHNLTITFSLQGQENLGIKGPITGTLNDDEYPKEMTISIGEGNKKQTLGVLYLCNLTFTTSSGHFAGQMVAEGAGQAVTKVNAVFSTLHRSPYMYFTVFAENPGSPGGIGVADGNAWYSFEHMAYQGEDDSFEPDVDATWIGNGYDLILANTGGGSRTGLVGLFGEHPLSVLKIRSIKPKTLKAGTTTKLTMKHKGAVPGTLVSMTRLSNSGVARLQRFDWFPDHFDIYIQVPAGGTGQYRLKLVKPGGWFRDAKGVLTVN